MDNIQTTGGVFTDEIRQLVLSNIKKVFFCEEEDIEELVPVQAGRYKNLIKVVPYGPKVWINYVPYKEQYLSNIH